MEQIYFVRDGAAAGTDDGSPEVLYVYGQYSYAGSVKDLPPLHGAEDLPRVLMHIQSIQGSIPFLSETDVVPAASPHKQTIDTVRSVLSFARDELSTATEEIATLAETETWLDSEDSSLYFELECQPTFTFRDALVVFAKTFISDVMVTLIYFRGRILLTLSEAASEEQPLVDTLFPQIYGRRRGLQLRAYDHADFSKLSVWEASDPVPDPVGDDDEEGVLDDDGLEDEDDEDGDLGLGMGMDNLPGLEDLRGEGYVQIYAVMRPQVRGSSIREALFRFGSWVYSGEVDLGVPRLHLGDVPDVLPALQRQQGGLGFLCEAASFPRDHHLTPVVHQFLSCVAFLEQEMVACQDTLEELASHGVTSWIDAEWAASFFELAFEETPDLRNVEVIAAKVYGTTGIVLHCVWFSGSLYCVLSDIAPDAPLLDVAFPDVTARCRGVQVKAYRGTEGPRGGGATMPRPRRLTCWEGRRRGVPGVGYGAVAAIEADLSGESKARDIMARARERAEEEERMRAATVAAMSGKVAKAKVEPADDLDAGDGKEDEKEEPEPKLAVAAAAPSSSASGGGKQPTTTTTTKKQSDSKEEETEDLKPSKPRPKRPAGPLPGLGGARATHHLRPLEHGADPKSSRLLSNLPPLSDKAAVSAPFDPLTGKPRI